MDLYVDTLFKPEDESLWNKVEERGEEIPLSETCPIIFYKRPQELSNNPVLFSHKKESNQPIRGAIDDSVLLSALVSVKLDSRDILQRLILQDNDDDWLTKGKITFRYFRNGIWDEISVDTFIPVFQDENSILKPIFGRSADSDEFYIPLFEKAFAKINGTYESIKYIKIDDILTNLTGGPSNKPKYVDLLKSNLLWEILVNHYESANITMCSKQDENEVNIASPSGITIKYLYKIIFAKEVGGLKMVQLYNLFQLSEWNGDWSSHSEKWETFPEIKQLLIKEGVDVERTPGSPIVWMVYEDFQNSFNEIYINRIYDDNYYQILINSKWSEKTAAGKFTPCDPIPDDNQFKKLRHLSKEVDSQWCNNPQFNLLTPTNTSVYIELNQHDTKLLVSKECVEIHIDVIKRKNRRKLSREFIFNKSKLVASSIDDIYNYQYPSKSVCCHKIDLDRNHAYTIIVCTEKTGIDLPFTLRIFSTVNVELLPVSGTSSSSMTGRWRTKVGEIFTSGGSPISISKSNNISPNMKWCQNPQYLITFPPGSSPTLAINLQRTDDAIKNVKESNVASLPKLGMTLLSPPEKGIPKKSAISEIAHNPNYIEVVNIYSSLNSFELGKKRVFTVYDSEFVAYNSYSQHKSSSMILRKLDSEVVKYGLIFVPHLSQSSVEAKYKFIIHSDVNFQINELSSKNSQTIAGSWSEKLSGGCHLHPTKMDNPIFKLTIYNSAEVTITLRRPPKLWRKNIATDCVGSMIGFYLSSNQNMQGACVIIDSKPWSETPFLPTNEVSTPPKFFLDANNEGESYYIMPTTLDPKKYGPFFLTVSSPAKFLLQKFSKH